MSQKFIDLTGLKYFWDKKVKKHVDSVKSNLEVAIDAVDTAVADKISISEADNRYAKKTDVTGLFNYRGVSESAILATLGTESQNNISEGDVFSIKSNFGNTDYFVDGYEYEYDSEGNFLEAKTKKTTTYYPAGTNVVAVKVNPAAYNTNFPEIRVILQTNGGLMWEVYGGAVAVDTATTEDLNKEFDIETETTNS